MVVEMIKLRCVYIHIFNKIIYFFLLQAVAEDAKEAKKILTMPDDVAMLGEIFYITQALNPL